MSYLLTGFRLLLAFLSQTRKAFLIFHYFVFVFAFVFFSFFLFVFSSLFLWMSDVFLLPIRYDIQVVQKKKFNDTYKLSKNLSSGNEWYCHQAFRALNQATGTA